MEKSILIIDGHYFLFRSFAVPFKFYSKQKKIPLHVITTFLKLVKRSLEVASVDTIVSGLIVVFDSQGPNPNNAIEPEYKANRKAAFDEDEDSPFHHYANIRKVLSALGIFHTESVGYEADDLIASICNQYSSTKKIYISSRDSDFYQLLSERVSQIILLNKGNHRLMTHNGLIDELGIAPSDYVRWKSLVGDKTDNIIGIRGIGSKTATKIINGEVQFDYSKYSDKLTLNEQLISLSKSVKLPFNMSDIRYKAQLLTTSNIDIFEKVGFD